MINVTDPGRNIIWIASYPKSGNTWVRFLLLNLLYGKQESSERLDKLVPDIHKRGFIVPPPGSSLTYVKSHLKMSASMPFLERTAGFIYVVRNPIDVMLSNLNYVYLTYRTPDNPEIREDVKNDYIAQFIGHRGDPRWLKQGMGSWDGHVESWCANPHQLPGFFVRYEDMLEDTLSEMRRLCDFLGLEKTDAEIQEAVNQSTFSRMRSIEQRELENKVEGFFFSEYRKQRSDTPDRFMNSGKSGEGSRRLSHDQRNAVLSLFHPMLTKLGYSMDRDGRIVVAGKGQANAK